MSVYTPAPRPDGPRATMASASTTTPVASSRRAPLGTLEWAESTGGRLRMRDRLRLLGQGSLTQVPDASRRLAAGLGLRPRKLASFDLDDLRVPDSQAAREAREVAGQMRPEMLVNHSHRTYAWAAVLAAHEGVSYDEEVVYVSSLLHDYGLASEHDGKAPGTCFTLIGAGAVQDAGRAGGWDEERCREAAEIVTMHMNLRIPSTCVEARLVTAATQLDVIGQGFWRVHPDTVDAVLTRYPRSGVKDGMIERFQTQARANPGTRAHFYQRYLALRWLIRFAPWDE